MAFDSTLTAQCHPRSTERLAHNNSRIRGETVNKGPSRREFVKAAVAAAAAGAASLPASAGQAGTDAKPAKSGAASEHTAPGSIAFPRVFTGRNLARISCPLGGIGTGGIGLGGR